MFPLIRVINVYVKQGKENIMAKKNLKEAALRYEINVHIDETLEVLKKLGFVENSDMFFDSLAYDWIDNEPSEKDMDKVLKALGY